MRGLVLVTTLLAGCFTTGEDGNFNFGDGNEEGDFDPGIDRPIGVGGVVHLTVGSAGASVEAPLRVFTEDLSVLQVEGVNGLTIDVRAIGEGTSAITVEDANGVSDRITLETAVVRAATVEPYNLDVFGVLAATEGLSVVAGDVVTLLGTPFDEGGRALTGDGLFAWASDPADAVSFAAVDGVDHRSVATVSGTGAATVTAGYLSTYDLMRRGDDEGLRVRHVADGGLETVTSLELAGGTGVSTLLVVADDADRLVWAGVETFDVDLEVLEGPETLAAAAVYSPLSYGPALNLCPGSGRIRLSWLGVSTEVDLVVTQPAEGIALPPTCP